MERVLEPELMDEPAQATAYARADFAGVNQGFVDRFAAEFPALTRGRVVDLGCGPADIPVRLLRARPGLHVAAVDAAAAMLAEARPVVARAAGRILLVQARLPDLPFADGTFDAVLSNSLLHHLPQAAPFWREIVRVAARGAPVMVMDLMRPASPADARMLVATHAGGEDPILQRDFYASLCAAFTVEEVRRQLTAVSGSLFCRPVSDRHWVVSGRLA
jgi:ubiquinone/menaquinone biosynthesis C-methylase UbiE